MTEKELKKLSRNELLELLLMQTRRTEELEAKLEESERKLNDRIITGTSAGSIAEAALQINGVFEAAEAAAKQYLDSVKVYSDRCDKMIADTKHRCAEMERRAQEKVMMLKAEVDRLQLEWKNSEWRDSESEDPDLDHSDSKAPETEASEAEASGSEES